MFYSIKTTLLMISLQLSTSQSCEIQGMNTGFCDYRYLPKSFDLEVIKEANKNWQHGTDGPCKEGEADHCMPFCGRLVFTLSCVNSFQSFISKIFFLFFRKDTLQITTLHVYQIFLKLKVFIIDTQQGRKTSGWKVTF